MEEIGIEGQPRHKELEFRCEGEVYLNSRLSLKGSS